MIVLKQQTQVSTENHPCQASPKSLLTPTAARDNTGHMSDPHRSFRENLASGRHTLTDMKTNSLTGLQNGTYVKHHLRATPYAQHIFKCWHDNWAAGALGDISRWWHSPCSLSFSHHSGHEATPTAHQEVRVYLLPFGAHLTMVEAVTSLALGGGTWKGHASQKSLPGNIMVTTAITLEKKQAPFLKTNTTKTLLLITYSCLKQTASINQLLEYLTYLDPQCNIPPPGNTASNSSAAKKSPSPCWLHNSRVIDLRQVTPMCYKHQQKLEKPDPLE